MAELAPAEALLISALEINHGHPEANLFAALCAARRLHLPQRQDPTRPSDRSNPTIRRMMNATSHALRSDWRHFDAASDKLIVDESIALSHPTLSMHIGKPLVWRRTALNNGEQAVLYALVQLSSTELLKVCMTTSLRRPAVAGRRRGPLTRLANPAAEDEEPPALPPAAQARRRLRSHAMAVERMSAHRAARVDD